MKFAVVLENPFEGTAIREKDSRKGGKMKYFPEENWVSIHSAVPSTQSEQKREEWIKHKALLFLKKPEQK